MTGRVWRSVPGRRWSGARRAAPVLASLVIGASLMVAVPPVAAATAVTDLGTLPGGTFTTGNAINTGEQVAGYSDRPDQRTNAALWSPGGSGTFGVVDLGTLPGGARSEAFGINPAGQVVGSSDTGGPNQSEHAVLWTATG